MAKFDIFCVLNLLGGLSLFLFGMKTMGSNLEKISGGKLEGILERMTNTRIKGVLLGMIVTAIIQSSGAVTVMVVGFVNSGIMELGQVIGIVMGAHIGTTITAWLLSLTGISGGSVLLSLLKPSSFAPALAFVGVVIVMFIKNDKKKNIGYILLGFGTLMMGMTFMSDAMSVLRDIPEFTGILTKFSNPLLGVLAGTILTAAIQSSSASVGILQALSTTGAITVGAAFPIILGQNIGQCVPVLLSSIGTNKNAKRTAGVYLTTSVLGVIAALILYYGINAFVELPFVANTVNPVGIAIIHTTFNVFTTVILFPFCKQLEKLMCLIIKDKENEENEENAPLVDERFLLTPAYALDKVKERCDEMAELAKKNILLSIDFIKVYNRTKDEKIKNNEKKLDGFEDELETYLVRISSMHLTFAESMRLNKYSHAIGNFERIGDYGVNILKTKRAMHQSKIHFSPDANKELEIMGKAVSEIVENATRAFVNDDVDLARTVEPLEQVINNLKAELREKHSKRMENGECTVEHGMLFFDIINSFERIADHCSNLAVCIIELSQGSYQTHSYLKGVKSSNNKTFMQEFEAYLAKYELKD